MIVETRKIPKDHRRRGENRGSKTQAMRGGVKWEDLGKPLIENGEDKWYRERGVKLDSRRLIGRKLGNHWYRAMF